MSSTVTLIRMAAPRAKAATYVAVPACRALDVVARAAGVFAEIAGDDLNPADFDADTMPWRTLPGIEPLAAAAVGQGVMPVVILGTTVHGQWTSWYPPCPPPPAPPD